MYSIGPVRVLRYLGRYCRLQMYDAACLSNERLGYLAVSMLSPRCQWARGGGGQSGQGREAWGCLSVPRTKRMRSLPPSSRLSCGACCCRAFFNSTSPFFLFLLVPPKVRRRRSAGEGAWQGKDPEARAGDGPGLLQRPLAGVGYLAGLSSGRSSHVALPS